MVVHTLAQVLGKSRRSLGSESSAHEASYKAYHSCADHQSAHFEYVVHITHINSFINDRCHEVWDGQFHDYLDYH